jgi:hypothetical protein
MARRFDPVDLVALPILDANDACVLAQSLEAAALDDKGKPRKLPEAVKAALADVTEDRAALQEALGGVEEETPEVRQADLDEDAAIGALHDLCWAWKRVAGKIEEGDIGDTLQRRLFSEGLAFVNIKPHLEWGVVETKLQTIQREGLAEKFERLGAGPLLEHLNKVHAHYGKVTGATQALPVQMSLQVREKLSALQGSLRHYVAAVTGSVLRKKPETKELADLLLAPVMEWESRPRNKKPPRGGAGGGGSGATGGE